MSPSVKKADILLVDDIPDNIRFLSSFLLEQGYQVRKAIHGQMALRAVETLCPDLILLDVNLPDINGYEVCRQLKANPDTAAIPVIFLSAGNEAIDKVRAFQMGAVDYITKPFYLEEVLIRIQTQLTIQSLQKELQTQNQHLKQTLEELKIAQANLVQQEKMASLRKVVAGVAHEINNPLSFIACNLQPTQDYIDQLLGFIRLYQQKFPSAADPDIAAYLAEIDLEFLQQDALHILSSMGNGAARIQAVVDALRTFIRLDEAGMKRISLQDSIETVLTLLHHRLAGRADAPAIALHNDYAQLPPITCYGDQINQAIFNLLCNAIDAIEEKRSQLNGAITDIASQITIRTELLDPETISIQIRDNGIGIPVEHQTQIFEPFFTTKSAGQGVGLGLATTRRIIEDVHGGALTYESVVGEGTEFCIRLPIWNAP